MKDFAAKKFSRLKTAAALNFHLLYSKNFAGEEKIETELNQSVVLIVLGYGIWKKSLTSKFFILQSFLKMHVGPYIIAHACTLAQLFFTIATAPPYS